jgi:hypothetical protein
MSALGQKPTPNGQACGSLYREAGDVAARTSEARGETAGDRIGHVHEHDRNRPRLTRKGPGHERGWTEDHVGPKIDQFFC